MDTVFSAEQSDAERSTVSVAALVYYVAFEIADRNVQKVFYLAHISQSCGL